MNQAIKECWDDFKKDITWNNIKIVACIGLPTAICLYGWTFWFQRLSELMQSKPYHNPTTPDQALVVICIIAGMCAPMWFIATVVPMFGGWFGRVTKIFIDVKTWVIVWDDKEYFVRDMPEPERKQIESLLVNYKSKLQLKKERLASKSWLRRTFS